MHFRVGFEGPLHLLTLHHLHIKAWSNEHTPQSHFSARGPQQRDKGWDNDQVSKSTWHSHCKIPPFVRLIFCQNLTRESRCHPNAFESLNSRDEKRVFDNKTKLPMKEGSMIFCCLDSSGGIISERETVFSRVHWNKQCLQPSNQVNYSSEWKAEQESGL